MANPTPAGQPKPEWERHFLHERDYRDVTVSLGFRTAPKKPDPAYGILIPAGPIRIIKGGQLQAEMTKRGHTALAFDECQCKTSRP